MNDAYVTLVGNVVADPTHVRLDSGVHVASVRIASMSRRFDRALGRWRDACTLVLTVSCWRALAENVATSVRQGDPVVVTGRLRIRNDPGKAGERRTSVEIEATTVGHDLSRGVAHFQRAGARGTATERRAADEVAAPRALAEGPDTTLGATDEALSGGDASERSAA